MTDSPEGRFGVIEVIDAPKGKAPTVGTLWPVFTAIEWFELPGPGRSGAAVALDRQTANFEHLFGEEVMVDGDLYRCWAIERLAHSPPWMKGEKITLLLELAEKSELGRLAGKRTL